MHSQPRISLLHQTGIAWFCALSSLLHAERAPRSPAQLVEESQVVFVGQITDRKIGVERSHIETGFGNYDWAVDLTFRVQRVEKGQLDGADSIVARCFRVKCRKSIFESVSVSGNHPIPEVGTEVRAHLYRQGALWRVVFPNGLVPLSGEAPDAMAITELRSRHYTFWLPIELMICIAVVGLLLFLVLKMIRWIRRLAACRT